MVMLGLRGSSRDVVGVVTAVNGVVVVWWKGVVGVGVGVEKGRSTSIPCNAIEVELDFLRVLVEIEPELGSHPIDSEPKPNKVEPEEALALTVSLRAREDLDRAVGRDGEVGNGVFGVSGKGAVEADKDVEAERGGSTSISSSLSMSLRMNKPPRPRVGCTTRSLGLHVVVEVVFRRRFRFFRFWCFFEWPESLWSVFEEG